MTEKFDLEAIEYRHKLDELVPDGYGYDTTRKSVHLDRAALIAEVRRLEAKLAAAYEDAAKIVDALTPDPTCPCGECMKARQIAAELRARANGDKSP